MINPFILILLVLAFVFFLIAAFWQSNPAPGSRPSFMALGLMCWVMAEIMIRALHG